VPCAYEVCVAGYTHIHVFTSPFSQRCHKKIKSFERDFLWENREEKKKWALVAWDKIYKPKVHGGLGLHDPEILSRVLGETLWWRSLKESVTPWAMFWKNKYASN